MKEDNKVKAALLALWDAISPAELQRLTAEHPDVVRQVKEALGVKS